MLRERRGGRERGRREKARKGLGSKGSEVERNKYLGERKGERKR